MRILNLYAGIGGNRKLWENAEIVSVELNPQIAEIYKDLYPNDTLIIADAHEYLLNNFNKGFDFIWSSPPCQSHSSFRQNIGVRFRGVKPEYPDMRLYQEIILLKHNIGNKGVWFVVENVTPYYLPLIRPDKQIKRHWFWTNIDFIE
jgi:DNA (cytosine-5)-methyltransferase 1